MKMDNDNFRDDRTPLKRAINAIPISSHCYLADFPQDHCMVTTVHGGILASAILSSVRKHFGTTLASCRQPHTFSANLQYFRPGVAGRATIEIKDSKLGAATSTVHVSLIQNGKECVVGYVSNMDLGVARGVSFPTNYTLFPSATPFNIGELERNGSDGNWIRYEYPYHPKSVIKAITHFRWTVPINGPPLPNITDTLLSPIHPDDAFTNEMLGSVVDMFVRPVENYHQGTYSTKMLAERALRIAAETPRKEDIDEFGLKLTRFGYPTLSLNLEIKKLLPPQGVKWLLVRALVKEVKNGRVDVEVFILDEGLELVALSHHIEFVVDLFQGVGQGRRLPEGKL